jgi:sirohydrochlorin ferrochelatase
MQGTSWRDLYKAAMLEIDLSKMQARIDAAVAAVHLRMEEVGRSDGDSRAEVQEMSDALQNLQTLRKMNDRISSPQVAPKNNSAQEGVL